jgi:phosphotransferase system enzyme I (PtsI)
VSERALQGRPASPGLARGPVHRLAAAAATRLPAGDPAREAADLMAAMARSLAALNALAQGCDDESADILGFQVALLEDEELTRTAFEAIAAGAAADAAFAHALDAEIAGYQSAEDDYFKARAGDLQDLRDRVLLALADIEEGPALPSGAVIAALDMPPSRFLSMDWTKGGAIVLSGGSPSSHVAMLARSRGVPMVVGAGHQVLDAEGEALVDGSSGEIILDPGPDSASRFAGRQAS